MDAGAVAAIVVAGVFAIMGFLFWLSIACTSFARFTALDTREDTWDRNPRSSTQLEF
jgi:hypothetical protein